MLPALTTNLPPIFLKKPLIAQHQKVTTSLLKGPFVPPEKQEEEKAGLQARLTPLPHHDLVVDKLAENANIVFREKPTDKFFVFTRNGLIYDKNIHRGEPGEYINRELNKFNDNVLSSERSKEMDKARDSYNKVTKIENIDLKFIHEAENKLQEKRDSLIQEQRKSKIQANINTKNKNKQADLEP